MKYLLLILLLPLSGCATLELLENRVSCAVGRDEVYVNSMYGSNGITSKVSKKDAEAILAACKRGA